MHGRIRDKHRRIADINTNHQSALPTAELFENQRWYYGYRYDEQANRHIDVKLLVLSTVVCYAVLTLFSKLLKQMCIRDRLRAIML